MGTVVVPPGTPGDVATGIRTALELASVRAGWAGLCDRLVCRAYGFANSGYVSASAHWAAMAASGHGHAGDRCPPVGAFVFWSTRGPDGHAAMVVQSDPACDPNRIKVVSTSVLDSRTGNDGGIYLVSLSQIELGFVALGKNIDLIHKDARSLVGDSLDLDEASREEFPQDNRWDYLLSVPEMEKIVGLEPHSAKDDQVSVVIKKKKNAESYLLSHLKVGVKIANWYWVSRGKVTFSRMDRVRRSLDQNGIEFRGRQLRTFE